MSITGDLWSDNGMGLFGIYAHGITETWVIEKKLIGLVACESQRHTAENITTWTNDALKSISMDAICVAGSIEQLSGTAHTHRLHASWNMRGARGGGRAGAGHGSSPVSRKSPGIHW